MLIQHPKSSSLLVDFFIQGQLSFLMKHHSSSKHISHLMLSLDQSSLGYLPERFDLSNEMNVHHDDDHRTCGRNSKVILIMLVMMIIIIIIGTW